MMRVRTTLAAIVGGTLLLAGCGATDNPSATGNGAPATAAATGTVQGRVHGGQSPIVGASVTVYQTVNGAAPTQVGSTATTDSTGAFTVDFSCSDVSGLLYVVSQSGDPGGGTNTAVNLMTALGDCASLPSFVNINEITTVAAAYALPGFIGVTGNPPNQTVSVQTVNNSTTANAQSGLSNAFANAALLADPLTGLASTTLSTKQAAAAQKLYSLANAVGACVNSTGGNSGQCQALFQCAASGATVSGSSCTGGASPASDTLSAALSVARNAGTVSIAGVYNVAGTHPLFSPALSAAPNDWTMALRFSNLANSDTDPDLVIDQSGNVWFLSFTTKTLREISPAGASLRSIQLKCFPSRLAIDASGDVWLSCGASAALFKYSATGSLLSPNGYTGGGLVNPIQISFDPSGNAWVPNQNKPEVNKFSAAGAVLSGANGYTGGISGGATSIANDPSGNAWVGVTNSGVAELNSSGVALSGTNGYKNGAAGFGISLDASGNVWAVRNSTPYGLSKLDSSGTVQPGSPYIGGGLVQPSTTAVDAAGNIWVSNGAKCDGTNACISEFSNSGVALSPSTGFITAGSTVLNKVAIDASGNVWSIDNATAGSIIELVGAATPTRTPLVATIASGAYTFNP